MADDQPDSNNSGHPQHTFRTRAQASHVDPKAKRFDIFLIDTHWNTPVSKAIRSHLRLLQEYQPQDSFYELTREQSVEVLRHDPKMIGLDPTLVVYDIYASTCGDSGNYRGFRLHLGLMKNGEQALARLHEFLRFLAEHRSADRLDREVKRELHREGIDGMIKILRETSLEMLGE